jgi:YVTN family beta-propeller protein
LVGTRGFPRRNEIERHFVNILDNPAVKGYTFGLDTVKCGDGLNPPELKELYLKRIVKILVIIGIVALCAGNSGLVPIKADSNDPVSKISSLLSLHVRLKSQASTNPDIILSGQTVFAGMTTYSDSTFLNREKVFLYFNQPPAASQLNDLASLGVTVYPDSWIPPVGNFQTGFMLADMPVDQLAALSAKGYIVQMDTAEKESQPEDDLARAAMGVDSVWSGGNSGAGVTVAVLDSGIDTTNPDFPVLDSTNSKDYSSYPTLDDTITNTITGHGTHVAGSLLGRGVNSPNYKGVAPGARLVFLKVGNDTNSNATSSAIIYALKAAVNTYHAKIINLSYGGWSEYHDGTDAVCQAVDYATSQGAAVFTAAGNFAAKGWHYSGIVNAHSTTSDIPVTVSSGTNTLPMNLVWSDNLGPLSYLTLQYYDASDTPLAYLVGSPSQSPRGTKSILSELSSQYAPGTYNLRVQNDSGEDLLFHIYVIAGDNAVKFANPDPNYTIDSPAEADSAIAIGAYTTRPSWTDYRGITQNATSAIVDSIAAFSSIGPRVDVAAPEKPNIVAPGQVIISVRDNTVYPWPAYNTLADVFPYAKNIIDNDGVNFNGTGPADYFVMQGTSMASPLAAGVGALLLSRNPALTPVQIRHAIEITAADKGAPGLDNIYGWGSVNAGAAITAQTTLSSYSDAAHSTLCNNFRNSATQTIAYLYGTGFLINHRYQIAYYDGANNKIARYYVMSDSTGALSSHHAFVQGANSPGLWHATVTEPEFNLSSPYNSMSFYAIVTGSFTVQAPAIVTPGPAIAATIPLGIGSHFPAAVGVNSQTNRIYVSSIQGNNVSVIDGATDGIIAVSGVEMWPQGIAVNPVTNRIYVTNSFSHSVSVIDGSDNTVIANVDVGNLPFRLGVNTQTDRIYVANSWSDTVSVLDGATNTVTATINVGSGPAGIAVNPLTNLIYVSNDGSNNISVIDGTLNAIVATIPVGTGPGGMDINPFTGYLYVANFGDNTVSAIDTVNNTVVATVSVGLSPRGVVVNTTTNHIYIANFNSDTVSIIDGTNNSIMTTLNVDNHPYGVGANTATNRIYVANWGSDSVSVIQDTSDYNPPVNLPAASNLSTDILIVGLTGMIVVLLWYRQKVRAGKTG